MYEITNRENDFKESATYRILASKNALREIRDISSCFSTEDILRSERSGVIINVNSFASNNLDEVIMKVQNDLKVSKAKDHLLTISGTVTMSDFSRLSEIAEETGKNVLVGAVYDDENQNVLTTLVSY